MNQTIFNYLKEYNSEVFLINRLLVSTFIHFKKIKVKKNKKILDLIISEENKKEYQFLKEFMDLIEIVDRDFCFEELLELFEFVISPFDKLINGAIYTPKDIRKFITFESFSYCKKDVKSVKVVDISCGCGGFLIDAVNILKEKTNKSYKEIFANNIFGVDIQEYSIERTKILLSLLALVNNEDIKEFNFNLHAENSLEFDWKDENEQIRKNDGFDIILGNPPYVCSRNMDEETKSLMSKWSTCSTGHPDLYIPFFEIGFSLLSKNGILGYITVNSFIKSVNGRAIRKYFQDNKVDLKILDFEDEQIFNSRMTYTAICFLSNNKSESIKYKPIKKTDLDNPINFEEYLYSEIENKNGWYVKNKDIVTKIENVGISLGDIYNTKSGIATLKNSIYIFKPIKETKKYYYIDDEIKIEKNICKNIVNSNLLVKTDNIDTFIEKIIFPYGYDEKNQVYVIPEDTMKKNFSCAYEYLLANKEILYNRDKGKGKDYKYWYAFGRNQSLERSKYKLLFPQMAKKGFQSCLSYDENLYFYNGMAAMSNNLEKLEILKQVFKSDIFWLYVKSISKPYASNYFSLGRNYMKGFGIYKFSENEKQYILNEQNLDVLNLFFNNKYKL